MSGWKPDTTLEAAMFVALALSATLASTPASCEALKSLALPNTTIVAAEMVAAGPYTAPNPFGAGAAGGPRGAPPDAAPAPGRGGRGQAAPPLMLPAHCRVNAILRPSSDSEIEMEAWFPDNWNGKFQ